MGQGGAPEAPLEKGWGKEVLLRPPLRRDSEVWRPISKTRIDLLVFQSWEGNLFPCRSGGGGVGDEKSRGGWSIKIM